MAHITRLILIFSFNFIYCREVPHRVVRQTWQWPSGFSTGFGSSSRSGFGRSAGGTSSSSFSFPDMFGQNFASSSPFGTFSFQPSFTFSSPAAPSNFKSFNDIATSFGSNQNADNFFSSSSPSWTNIQPQQRPTSTFFSPAPATAPLQFSMPSLTSSMVMPDLQTQISNIFKQNGMWSLPQNFVQDKFSEAWAKSTQQFGNGITTTGFSSGAPISSPVGFSTLQFGSPGSQSDMFAGTRPDSLNIAKNAFTLEDFSKSLSKQLNFNRSTAAVALPLVSISPTQAAPPSNQPVPVVDSAPVAPVTIQVASAPAEPSPVQADVQAPVPVAVQAPDSPAGAKAFPECGQEQPVVAIRDFMNPDKQPACAKRRYRAHNGECNNVCFPQRGKESTVFIRLIGADYADGISEPRRNSRNQPLPSARLVSSSLITTKVRLAPTWTNMFMQFGQFLDHDITNTPRAQLSADAPQCCGATNPHPQCFSITVPSNDPFYSKFNQNCMEFVRSLPGIRPGCRLGAREQMNQQTSFIDASQIYAVRQKDVKALRDFDGGRLKTVAPIASNPSYTLLPGSGNTCVDGSTDQPCFAAGDSRCNVQLGLQTLHTVFMRHHNNLVARLFRLNPNWDDEKLYQEARHIIAAQLQHITYNEWLPLMLGSDAVDKMGLKVMTSGRYTGYNVTIHPGLINEFSTAAMRVGHAMVPSKFDRLGADFTLKNSVKVRDTFFKSSTLYQNDAVDEIVRGLSQQKGKVIENSVTGDLSQMLFLDESAGFGLDIVSLNIQRGRDHGLTGWMKFRRLCGLQTVDNFNDLKGLNILPEDTINRLAAVYESVDDIDLYPAGIAEFHVGEAFLGPTFACIMSEQFWRLRVGDRFWYENALPFASSFTDPQLEQLRRTTLARILCDSVSGLGSIQASVFETVSDSNPRVPCSQIPTVSFKSWTGI